MTTSAASLGGRRRGTASRAGARAAAWFLFVAAIAVLLFWPLRRPLPPAPPVLATLPAFELTDQEGRPFGSNDLEGRVWVASFIFTRCDTVCPAISAKMARIQPLVEDLGPAFHLVSFSADPEFDTPARLAQYAKNYSARPGLWSFLTGSPVAMREVAVQGLKMSLGDERSDDGRFEGIFHDTHLVLVDRKGRVRAYYDSQDEKVIDAVVRDARLLVSHDR